MKYCKNIVNIQLASEVEGGKDERAAITVVTSLSISLKYSFHAASEILETLS